MMETARTSETSINNFLHDCTSQKTNLNKGIISLNSVSKLMFVMVTGYVVFEVPTGFLNII
jgi:hypothetical protein